MAVRIPLVTDFDGRGIRKAIAEFKQLESGTDKFAFAMQKALLPAVAVLGGLGAAAASSVKKAIEAQSEQARLETILKTTGMATKEQIKDLNNQAKALGRVGVATGGNITTLQSQLATFDLTGQTIQKLTPAIVDYVIAEKGAAASTEDFKSMTNGLAQALQGNFTALTKSGFVLDKQTRNLIANGTETQRANALVKVLNSTYEGFNKTIGETPEGRLVRLRNSIEETQTTIGEVLLPVVETMLRQLQKFAEWAEKNPAKIMVLSGAIGLLAATVVTVNAGIKIYNALTIVTEALNNKLKTSFTRLQTAMGGIGLALGAAAAAYLIVTGRKKDNTQATKDLAAALQLEKDAQEESIQELIRRDSNTRKAITALDKMGLGLEDLTEFVQKGTGALAVSSKELDRARETAGVSGSEFMRLRQVMENLTGEYKDAADAAKLYNSVTSNLPTVTVPAAGRLKELADEYRKTKYGTDAAAKSTEKFGDSLRKAFVDARRNVADVLAGLRKNISDTISNGITSGINFGAIQTAAKEAGTTFMAGLAESVAKAKVFADRLQQLLRAGLSQDALAQVAQAGADAGTLIADELLAGGAATIGQANDLVAAAQKAAIDTGTLAGATYYNEGTVLAQQLTKGITDVISKYKIKLSSPGLTEKQLNRLRNRFALDVDFVMSQVPALAQGGIVASPTLALIGESGPEAVVPLDKMGQMGNVTINVSGGDPQAVVDALRRYMYQNGTIPIRVSG
jgi:hypothetical protein